MEVKTRDSLVTFKNAGNKGKSAKVTSRGTIKRLKFLLDISTRSQKQGRFGSNSLELICEDVLLLVDFQM
jgi:hypothetical protein